MKISNVDVMALEKDVGCGGSRPISVAVALHLEAAIPNFIIHEHHIANTTSGTIRECEYDYQPVNGYFSVPELPGIGQELSRRAVETADIVRF